MILGNFTLPDLPEANCKDIATPDLFFPDSANDYGRYADWAQAYCVSCEERSRCLAFALKHDIREGIWGGLTPSERARRQPAGSRAGVRLTQLDTVARLVDTGSTLLQACTEVGITVDTYKAYLRKHVGTTTQHNTTKD